MIAVPSNKNITKNKSIVALTNAPVLYVPLSAHRGSPARPLVSMNEKVLKNQLIGKADGTISANIHSPVSGLVKGFETMKDIDGKTGSFIVLSNDFEDKSVAWERKEILSPQDFATVLSEAGIVGAGGAQFPAHVKFSTQDNPVETFIINGAECEPYLTADFSLLKTKHKQLVQILTLIQKIYQPQNIVLAVERKNKELRSIYEPYRDILKVKLLPDSYPQGSEQQLIHSVTKKKLRKGTLPISQGILVCNVGTLWAMHQAVFEKQPVTTRVVTVYGEKMDNSGNYDIKIGTPIAHILNELNQEIDRENTHIVLGGPMMGKGVTDLNTPVSKGTSGVLFLKKRPLEEYNCIGCGYCVDVCPMKLMPLEFAFAYQRKDRKAMEDYQLDQCVECGACEYVCPSNVPLIASIKKGKIELLSV